MAATSLYATKAYSPYKAQVIRSTTQSIPNTTWTKVQANTEIYDTSGDYDNSTNYRFTARVAGFYLVRLNISMAGSLMQSGVDLYKNGSSIGAIIQDNRQNTLNTPQWFDIVKLNANDYLECFVWHNFGSAASMTGASCTYALWSV